MSLRRRTAILLSLTIVSAIAVLYFVLSEILLKSFADLEEQEARQAETRVINAINELLGNLQSTTSDYAHWDDMAHFAATGDQVFIENNFYDATFANLSLNFVLILNEAGDIVYEQGYSLNEGITIPVPEGLHDHLRDGSVLRNIADNTGGAGGILILGKAPLLIYLRSITNSLREGPTRGTLVLARLLDENAVARIETLSQTELTFQLLSDNEDSQALLSAINEGGGILFHRENEELLLGYAALNDVYGKPALVIQVETNRDIYQRGLAGIRLALGTVVVVSLIFAALYMFILEGFLLKRIGHLIGQVITIRDTPNLTYRITLDGKDELNQVADSINQMLESLATSRTEKANAEAANRAKSKLLGFISHELKTPLSAISLNAEILMETLISIPNERIPNYLNHILSSTRRMENLIKDLLDLSRLESGEIQLKVEPTCLSLLLYEATDSMSEAFRVKKQRLTLSASHDLPPVRADRERLMQIMLNLLSNAHKYTPEDGKINVVAQTVGIQETKQAVQVLVQDTGIGLEPEEQMKVFEKFFRSASPEVRQMPGTGLGLHITRSLIEMHEGQIWFESSKGQGTTFYFTLPLYTNGTEQTINQLS